jgi:hypothetical protein
MRLLGSPHTDALGEGITVSEEKKQARVQKIEVPIGLSVDSPMVIFHTDLETLGLAGGGAPPGGGESPTHLSCRLFRLSKWSHYVERRRYDGQAGPLLAGTVAPKWLAISETSATSEVCCLSHRRSAPWPRLRSIATGHLMFNRPVVHSVWAAHRRLGR